VADLVKVVLNGENNTDPAFKKLGDNSRRATSDLKSLGMTFNQVGRVASDFGGSGIASALIGMQSAIMVSKELNQELAKSNLALIGIGAAGFAAGSALTGIFEALLPSVKEEKQLDSRRKYLEIVDSTTAALYRMKDADAAEALAAKQAIDAKMLAIERLNRSIPETAAALAQLGELQARTEEKFAAEKEKKQADADAAMLKRQLDLKLELATYEDEFAARVIATESWKHEQIRQINADLLADEQGKSAARIAVYEVANLRIRQANQDRAEHEVQLERQVAVSKAQLQAQYVQAASTAFGNLANAARAAGKKGFAAYKAFATAQAIIDTYKAANAAYGALAGIPIVGPALGIAAAAAAIAAGLANVAQIQSAEPAGAFHGGIDYVPAGKSYLLEQGERVVQGPANRDLTEFLDGNGSGGGGATTVIVTIDGRELCRALGSYSQDGQLKIAAKAVV
jgi:hypothetical protein